MPNIDYRRISVLTALLLAGCAGQPSVQESLTPKPVETSPPVVAEFAVTEIDKSAIAEWIGYQETTEAVFDGLAKHGQLTASGEPFDMYGLMAAHSRLPVGALIQLDVGGRSVVVRVNDHAEDSAPLRLSYAAALALGVSGKTRVMVKLRVVAEEE